MCEPRVKRRRIRHDGSRASQMSVSFGLVCALRMLPDRFETVELHRTGPDV